MVSPTFHADYSTDVVLRDGTTIHIRPVRPDDDRQLLDLFQRMSEQSLYYRFMSIPKLDLPQVAKLALVDYDQQFVMVGEAGGPLAAIAGYYRSERDRTRAEVAFAIPDALQGRGIGTRMLERLAEIARERGVHAFDAYVLGENRRMMDVFLESGFEVSQELERGVFHVSLLLEPTEEFTERSAERSQKAASASMRPFFEPKVVAVIGASRDPDRIGSVTLRNLRETGYTGTLIPVHPEAETLEGLKAYPTVSSIPDAVDLAVIVVPAAHVADVIDDCIAKGVKALVVITAGFGETGGEGRVLEAHLVEKIRAAGIRMIGPNCMGIINTDPGVELNATFSPVYPPAGRVAFSTQSGALGLAILDYVKKLNLGISTFASIGNKADVSGNDLIQYLGGRRAHRRHPAVPRELRQSQEVRTDCPARRTQEADRRGEGRTVHGGSACRILAHRGARDERRAGRHAPAAGGRDPDAHARGAVRRRVAARAPAGAARPQRRDPHERRRPRHPRG